MAKQSEQFGVRFQGDGLCGNLGWKRPLSRKQAWDKVKEYQANSIVTMVEVVDFTKDATVYTWTR